MAKNFLNNFFGIDSDYEENDYDQQPATPAANYSAAPQSKSKVVPIERLHVVANKQPSADSSKIMLFEPRLYGEAKKIVDELLARHAVIINFTQMDVKVANKVVDFLNGAVYAIDGEMKRIGEQIFLCVPHGVEVSGKTAAEVKSNSERF